MKVYALRRGKQWVCAPSNADPLAHYDTRVIETKDKSQAWVTPNLDIAHQRQNLLRIMLGWATQIICIEQP